MFILKKGHQPGVYVPLRALFLVKECTLHGVKKNDATFNRYLFFMFQRQLVCI